MTATCSKYMPVPYGQDLSNALTPEQRLGLRDQARGARVLTPWVPSSEKHATDPEGRKASTRFLLTPNAHGATRARIVYCPAR